MKIGRLTVFDWEKKAEEVKLDENGNVIQEEQPEKKTDKKKILKRVGAGLVGAGALAVGVLAVLGRNGKTSDDPESEDDAAFDQLDSDDDCPSDTSNDFTEE